MTKSIFHMILECVSNYFLCTSRRTAVLSVETLSRHRGFRFVTIAMTLLTNLARERETKQFTKSSYIKINKVAFAIDYQSGN